MGSPLLQSYLHHCDQQGWRKDNCQIKLIEKIDDWMVQQTLLRRLRGMAKQGFYLHGPVGRGKSVIMNLFYQSFPGKKMRCHFHNLMNQLQDKSDLSLDQKVKRDFKGVKLLALDEFDVINIADAMIVKRVFQALLKQKIFIFITTNVKIEDLYKNGLHRERFLPFIQLLKDVFINHNLDGGEDYREMHLKQDPVYLPHSPESIDYLYALFKKGEKPLSRHDLDLKGRLWPLETVRDDSVWITFSDACEQARGVGDYKALCQKFKWIFVENIPTFDPQNSDLARRFIHLLDFVYEHHCGLCFTMVPTHIDHLFKGLEGTKIPYKRCLSRLKEIESIQYRSKI